MPGAELFVFSAPSPAALAAALDESRRQLGATPDRPLRAWAAEYATRPRSATRLAVVADDVDALVASLDRARDALRDTAAPKERIAPSVFYADGPAPGKTVLLFPGIGSAYDGMMDGLAQAFPGVAQWFHDMDALLAVMEPHAVASADEPNLLPQNGLPNFIGTMAMFG
ncbi:MAG: hypothetical protein KDE45_19195, partial [Caldilineaceae bacterium]|nr:hypothetical protein [Caldilineaceae bacterium]